MNYRSLADLNRCVMAKLADLPRDLDLIVGIPRSGLLAANLIALARNLPLTDLNGLIERRLLSGGRRLGGDTETFDWSALRRVLVVDDSICSGRQIAAVRSRLECTGWRRPTEFLAVYATPDRSHLVDYALEACPAPRVFEWNYLHHSVLDDTCMDIDGVLCRDPTRKENDDGPRYEAFLRSATPYLIPSRPVRYLVTCRLERYREATEQWLAAHGVSYGELIMLDLPDQQARRRLNAYGRFKADVYRDTRASLFVESDPSQAVEIAQRVAKPVICATTGQMVVPSIRAVVAGVRDRLRRAARRRVAMHLGGVLEGARAFASCRTEPAAGAAIK